MPHLIDLIEEYRKVKKDDLDRRMVFVLEMIEKAITYPSTEPITSSDVQAMDEYTNQLVKDLRKDRQYLCSVRISKIWKKRRHLCQLAEISHEIDKDYIDEIEYHEEIKWLAGDQGHRALSRLQHIYRV